MPGRALYYPEWGISDPNFLYDALLYWDRLACIVPHREFAPRPSHVDPEMQSVLELVHEEFVSPIVPTSGQKEAAGQRLTQLTETRAPPWLRAENLRASSSTASTLISVDKLSRSTAHRLQEAGWMTTASSGEPEQMNLISEAAGSLVMSALAEECSSERMPAITADTRRFVAMCNIALAELDSPRGVSCSAPGREPRSSHASNDATFLIAQIPGLVADNTVTPKALRLLLKARQDPDLAGQRDQFRMKVEEYLAQLHRADESERLAIADEFRQSFAEDLGRLGRDLRRAGLSTVLTAGGFAVATTLLGGGITAAAGVVIAIELSGIVAKHGLLDRPAALREHWASWAYSMRSGNLPLW